MCFVVIQMKVVRGFGVFLSGQDCRENLDFVKVCCKGNQFYLLFKFILFVCNRNIVFGSFFLSGYFFCFGQYYKNEVFQKKFKEKLCLEMCYYVDY